MYSSEWPILRVSLNHQEEHQMVNNPGEIEAVDPYKFLRLSRSIQVSCIEMDCR